jgi:DNA-binding NtrC family response regulator
MPSSSSTTRTKRRYAAWALAQTGGHRDKTAEKLGVDPKTLRKWLGDVGPDEPDPSP